MATITRALSRPLHSVGQAAPLQRARTARPTGRPAPLDGFDSGRASQARTNVRLGSVDAPPRQSAAPPVANTNVTLSAAVLNSVPTDLQGGTRFGQPVIKLYNARDVDRVPAAVWQAIADFGVTRDNQNGSWTALSADQVKAMVTRGFDSPKDATHFFGNLQVEVMPADERLARADGEKFSDGEVLAAIRSARQDDPTVSKAQLEVLATKYGVSDKQLTRVLDGLDNGRPGVAAPAEGAGTSKWFDSQVLDAMRQATAGGALSKDALRTLADQYQVPSEQFERCYAQLQQT